VQISPEPQEVPAATSGWVQVPVALHTSLVQALLSLVQAVPEALGLQLAVDWIGSHTWHAALGSVVPAA
jgi:hypothetical protein